MQASGYGLINLPASKVTCVDHSARSADNAKQGCRTTLLLAGYLLCINSVDMKALQKDLELADGETVTTRWGQLVPLLAAKGGSPENQCWW